MEIIENDPLLELKKNTAKIKDSFIELHKNSKSETRDADLPDPTPSLDGTGKTKQENSPTDKSSGPQLPSMSPVMNTSPLSAKNVSPLVNFPTTPRSTSKPTQKIIRKKSITSQISLDKFAFKKNVTTIDDSKTRTNTITSPTRAALTDRARPNCELNSAQNGNHSDDNTVGKNRKENVCFFWKDCQNAVKDTPHFTQGKSKVILTC